LVQTGGILYKTARGDVLQVWFVHDGVYKLSCHGE
jgi:hypothetical protein